MSGCRDPRTGGVLRRRIGPSRAFSRPRSVSSGYSHSVPQYAGPGDQLVENPRVGGGPIGGYLGWDRASTGRPEHADTARYQRTATADHPPRNRKPANAEDERDDVTAPVSRPLRSANATVPRCDDTGERAGRPLRLPGPDRRRRGRPPGPAAAPGAPGRDGLRQTSAAQRRTGTRRGTRMARRTCLRRARQRCTCR